MILAVLGGPLPASAQTTVLFVDSRSGDPVGGGAVTTLSPSEAVFTATRNERNGVSFTVGGAAWSLDFAASGDVALTPGAYAPALAFGSTIFDGISVSADGRRCATSTGRFIVLEAEYGANGGVVRFAADVEQHCDDGVPALFAALRYNSTIDSTIPFSGEYPRYELSLTSPLRGLVSGDAVACGGLDANCTRRLESAASVTLTARPAADNIFTGWAGACRGGTTTSVKIHMPKSCRADFDTVLPAAPRTILFLESLPGEFIGQGKSEIYTPNNAAIRAKAVDGGSGVDITVDSLGDASQSSWRLRFRAPAGAVLQPGSYPNVDRASDRTAVTPGLDVAVDNRACGWIGGNFVVHDLTSDPATGDLLTLSVDFEQHCKHWAEPALVGTLRFNSLEGLRVRQVSLLSSEPIEGQIRFNQTITWTALAHPDFGVEYSFWRKDPSRDWTLVQPYGPSPTYVWTPGYDLGTHSFQVWARRIGSTEPYEAWTGTTVSVQNYPMPTVTALTPSRPLPALVGVPITWIADAFGGIEPVLFQFWRLDAGTWQMVQDYGPRDYTWTPTSADVGTHALQVWVRNAGSLAPYDAYRAIAFDVRTPDPVTITGLTPAVPPPSPAGQTLTWTATATGGVSPLSYQFWRLDAGVWRMAQDYGPSATYRWTPGSADVGEHALQVWVRGFESNQPYDAWTGTSFSVSTATPARLISLARFPSSGLPAGMEIQWTADATGGLPPLQYQFWRLDRGTWTMARDWGSSNTYTWRTGLADVGSHALQVWARSAGSAAPYESWLGEAFTIGQPSIEIEYFSYYPSLHAGTPITWTAVAFGGVAPLQYQFWRLDGDSWRVVQDYSPSPMYTWTPTVADVGQHAIQIWIRNAGSTAPYDVWRGLAFVIAP